MLRNLFNIIKSFLNSNETSEGYKSHPESITQTPIKKSIGDLPNKFIVDNGFAIKLGTQQFELNDNEYKTLTVLLKETHFRYKDGKRPNQKYPFGQDDSSIAKMFNDIKNNKNHFYVIYKTNINENEIIGYLNLKIDNFKNKQVYKLDLIYIKPKIHSGIGKKLIEKLGNDYDLIMEVKTFNQHMIGIVEKLGFSKYYEDTTYNYSFFNNIK